MINYILFLNFLFNFVQNFMDLEVFEISIVKFDQNTFNESQEIEECPLYLEIPIVLIPLDLLP